MFWPVRRRACARAALASVTATAIALTPVASPRPALAAGGGSHAAAWSQFAASIKNKYAGKTLHVIMINDPFVPAFNTTASAFGDLTGAKVAVDTFGYDATYQKEVLSCSQHDKTYDLVVFDLPWMQKFVPCVDALNDYVKRTPPSLLQYDDFFPVMREGSTWDGKTVGFPFAPYFVLQTYNTKYYQSLGLHPAKTLAEFVDNARVATNNPKVPNVYGTSLNNQSGSAVGQAFFEYIYSISGGKAFKSEYPGSPKPYADMTPMFASKQGVAVVDLFKKLLASQPPGALNTAWNERQTNFATGHVAAVNEWDVTTPSLSDSAQSSVADAYATAPFPTDGRLVTQVGGWTMGINKFGTQRDMTWDFIKWFTSPETGLKFAAAGGFPARSSALTDPTLAKKYPWYATLRRVVPTAFADCRPRVSQSFDIISTLGTYIGKAIAGSMTSKDAMLAADRDIGTKLERAGYRVDSLDD